MVAFQYCDFINSVTTLYHLANHLLTSVLLKTLKPQPENIIITKINSVLKLRKFSPSSMATLGNKRKLAAVSRETPESTRDRRTPNMLDPELTQDYISQVSEEIEGRVTKKLSKEFSRTESRILGALSKLDEFLLNPQVRTCSVVAPGTSRSNNLENQGTNEDRPSDDPGPEVEFASPITGAETNPHIESSEDLHYATFTELNR